MNPRHADARRGNGSGRGATKVRLHTKEAAVRSVKVLVVAAAMLLACTARPALAGPPVVAADTSSTVGAEGPSRAAPSLSEAPPSTGSLAQLRARAGRRVVRVSVGEDDCKLSHARFESSGVVFSSGGREGMSLWAGAGESPRSSPIPWDRVNCIRVQHSHVALGAVTGALLGSWVVARTIHQGTGYDEIAAAGVVVLTPLAGLVGASVGALLGGSAFATWPIVWQRAPGQHGAR